jgi:hypothetical protein
MTPMSWSDMRSARFVTLCFLYSGLVLLAQSVVVYQFETSIGALSQFGVGVSILAVGLIRLWYPTVEKQNPANWGFFTYGMAALTIFLTALFLAQLLIL